jgi:hypothetical protein
LALLVPQRYLQMVVRAAEYGNDRVVLGAHYAMDVVGGRTLAMYDLAQLLVNKPAYVGLTLSGVKIDDFQMALAEARDHMTRRSKTAAAAVLPFGLCGIKVDLQTHRAT